MSERMLEELREYNDIKAVIQRLAGYVKEDMNETPEIILEALEVEIENLQGNIEHIYGLCEGCEGRRDGFTCPAQSFLDVEVLG